MRNSKCCDDMKNCPNCLGELDATFIGVYGSYQRRVTPYVCPDCGCNEIDAEAARIEQPKQKVKKMERLGQSFYVEYKGKKFSRYVYNGEVSWWLQDERSGRYDLFVDEADVTEEELEKVYQESFE